MATFAVSGQVQKNTFQDVVPLSNTSQVPSLDSFLPQFIDAVTGLSRGRSSVRTIAAVRRTWTGNVALI